MTTRWKNLHLMALGVLLGTVLGCKKEAADTSQTGLLELKKAFPNAKIQSKTTTNQTATAEIPTLAANEKATPEYFVGVAASAIQNNESPAAFKLISMVQKQPNLTADQQMALHEAMRGLQQDLIRRADAGDKAAQEAIRQLNTRPP